MEQEKIKTVIEEILGKMNIKVKTILIVKSPDAAHARFAIDTEESAILIGSKGENLSALNYLVRKIAGKTLGPDAKTKFVVDVNGYHEKALESVKAKAKIMSERARSFKVDIELEPMSSYERMLVHSFLEGEPDIKTESKGEGATRRVVIKYLGGI